MPGEFVPRRFIDVEVEVIFDRHPELSKKPGPPDGFMWEGQSFRVEEVISTWFDYSRKGRMAKNMEPAHAEAAARRGSWGVGRFTFRVRTGEGRIFDLYYDRAPEGAGDRAGHWVLFREMVPK
jgi:hypothetical protein